MRDGRVSLKENQKRSEMPRGDKRDSAGQKKGSNNLATPEVRRKIREGPFQRRRRLFGIPFNFGWAFPHVNGLGTPKHYPRAIAIRVRKHQEDLTEIYPNWPLVVRSIEVNKLHSQTPMLSAYQLSACPLQGKGAHLTSGASLAFTARRATSPHTNSTIRDSRSHACGMGSLSTP